MIFTTLIKTIVVGVAFVSSVFGEKVTSPEIIHHVNTHPSATWKAGASQWTEMDHEDLKSLLGAHIDYSNVFRTDFATTKDSSNSLECSLCEAAVGWVEGRLAGDYSVSKIESLLSHVCDIAPTKSLKSTCSQLVQTYTPQLIQYIIAKETPQVICQQIGVCQKALMNHMYRLEKMNEDNDLKCVLCNYIIEFAENALAKETTIEKIQEFLDNICTKIPKPYSKMCTGIVDTYTPELIQYILSKETPEVVCEQLRLCTDSEFELEAIPDSFDGRQVFGKCVHPVRDQQKCGSCWAFSASEVLSDRFCIYSNGTIDLVLSPQNMVSCDTKNYGCNGGMLNTAWNFLVNHGLVTDACMPYTSGDGNSGSCPTKCADGSDINKVYKAKNSRHVWTATNNVATIQREVMNGPVQIAFEVYQDFMAYKSGVYHHVTGKLLGGHAVELVGWGVDSGTPFWLVKNSWTTQWGEQGYFRILRGKNECGIESNAYTGEPLISAH